MLTISANKLAGISLIVGPAGATLIYIIFFLILGDMSIKPDNFAGQASDAAGASDVETLFTLLPAVGIILSLYGISVLRTHMTTGDAVWGMGQLMYFVGVVSFVIGWGILTTLPHGAGGGGTLIAASNGINSFGGLIFSAGIILIALVYAANRDGIMKIGAYITALVFLVSLIVSIIGQTTTDVWEVAGYIAGISYIVISLWSVAIGWDLYQKD